MRPPRRVGDGHHQSGGHPVAGGIAEEDGQAAVVERNEIVDVAADRVGDPVVGGDLVRIRLRRRLRDQIGLQVARELQLIAELDLVDQFHGQQDHDDHERACHFDERPWAEVAAIAHGVEERKEEPDEADEKKKAAVRCQAFCQSEEHGATRPDESPQAAGIAVDLRLVVGDQHLPRLRPLERVEVRHVLRLERRNRVFPELDPVVQFGHDPIVRRSRGRVTTR